MDSLTHKVVDKLVEPVLYRETILETVEIDG